VESGWAAAIDQTIFPLASEPHEPFNRKGLEELKNMDDDRQVKKLDKAPRLTMGGDVAKIAGEAHL
jgi:hypothetical protein